MTEPVDGRRAVEAALAAANKVVGDLVELIEDGHANRRANALRRGACGDLSDCTEEERALLGGLSPGEREAICLGEDAKAQLARFYDRLCWSEAYRIAAAASRRMLAPASSLMDDLYQDAWVLLLAAANGYDGSTRLHTYATTAIRRGLWDRVTRSSGLLNCPRREGNQAEKARARGLQAMAAGLPADPGLGTVALMGDACLCDVLACGSVAGLGEIFEEAEAIGVAAGVSPGRIMKAYLGDEGLTEFEEAAVEGTRSAAETSRKRRVRSNHGERR